MDRKKAIEVIQALLNSNYVGSLSGEDIEALNMAIRCLKVDEMYGLFFEDADWYDKAIKENERLKKELEVLKLDRNCEKPLIKCNICKYYTKMEGCLNDRCERFKDITHPYCYCYWGKEKGAD